MTKQELVEICRPFMHEIQIVVHGAPIDSAAYELVNGHGRINIRSALEPALKRCLAELVRLEPRVGQPYALELRAVIAQLKHAVGEA